MATITLNLNRSNNSALDKLSLSKPKSLKNSHWLLDYSSSGFSIVKPKVPMKLELKLQGLGERRDFIYFESLIYGWEVEL